MSEENGTPPAEGAAQDKRNNLGRRQAFLVSKWLRKNRTLLAELNLTKEQVAERAATETQIAVTPVSLRGIYSDFEIEPMWVRRKTDKTSPDVMAKRGQLSRLLAKQLMAVCDELDRVCRLLGEDFNPQAMIDLNVLRAVANGKQLNVEAELSK